MIPYANRIYGNDYFCFQQDSAPAYKAKRSIQWIEENLSDSISTNEWPASSPDINPLDFCIFGYILRKLGNRKSMTVEMFKNHLIKIWDQISVIHFSNVLGSLWQKKAEDLK